MSVAAAAFKAWATRAQLPGNTGALARTIGIGRPTLQAQYVRGRVEEWVLIKAARAHHFDPVTALAAFEEYSDVSAAPPSLAEVLSQVTLDDVLVELLHRRLPARADAAAALHVWPDPPIQDGVRQWIDAIDADGTLRRNLGSILRMASSNLSAQITSNRLTARGVAEVARLAGVSPATGFAVTGLLTLEEAGWPPRARQDAVEGLRDSALLDLISERISYAERAARRRDADEDTAHRIQDTLG